MTKRGQLKKRSQLSTNFQEKKNKKIGVSHYEKAQSNRHNSNRQ